MSRRGQRRDRRFRRFTVDGVDGSLMFSVGVQLLDISAGGMQVETRSHLAVGKRYRIKLQRGDDAMTISGRVAWCRLIGTRSGDAGDVSPLYLAGISFEEVLNQDGRDLVEFLHHTATVEPDRRIFGRFQDDAREALAADAELQFAVRCISLSGMLIETDFAPELDEVFPLRVHLGDSVLEVDGRVAYVERLLNGTAEVGIEFVGMNDERTSLIATWIQSEITEADPSVGD